MVQLFKISIIENVKQVFSKINQNVQKSNDLFKKTNSTINLLPNSIAGLNYKLEQLKEKQSKAFTINGIKYYRKEIEKTEKELIKLTKISEKKEFSLKGFFSGIGKNALQLGGAYLGINAISSTIKGSVQTLAEFEKYKAVLANTLGSQQAAEESMNQINSFAATTPYQVNELTNSYVKLANQGFIPTTIEMTKLGDLASSTGKSFEQLTEAILDAQTGQFERLKEFGITASSNGNTVSFSFKGVTTQVEKSGDAIRKYLLSLGDLKGVKGSMSSIMGTTGGLLSNIEDQLTMLKLSLGEAIKPLLEIFIKYGSKGIAWLTKLIKGLSAAINGISIDAQNASGIMKAAFNFTKFIKDNIQTIKALALVIASLVVGIKIWTVAQWALNVALDANPIGAIIVGVAALVTIVVVLVTKMNSIIAWFKKINTVGKIAIGWLFKVLSTIIPIIKIVFVLSFVIRKLIDNWEKIKNKTSQAYNSIKLFFVGVSVVTSMLAKKIIIFIAPLWNWIKNIFASISGFFQTVFDKIRSFITNSIFFIKEKIEALKNNFYNLRDKVINVFISIRDFILNLWDKLKNSNNLFVRILIAPFIFIENSVKWLWQRLQEFFGWLGNIAEKLGLKDIGKTFSIATNQAKIIEQSDTKQEGPINDNTILTPTPNGEKSNILDYTKGNDTSIVGQKSGGDRFLNINKLVEKIEIHTTNLKEGTQQIKEEIIKVLLAGINDTYNTV